MRTPVASLVPGFILAFMTVATYAAEPTTEEEKTFYALGAAVAQNLAQFNLTPAELEMVKAGVSDVALKKPSKVDVAAYYPKLNELHQKRIAAGSAEEKKAGEAFLAKAAAEPG